jgi:hypothetical protein
VSADTQTEWVLGDPKFHVAWQPDSLLQKTGAPWLSALAVAFHFGVQKLLLQPY